MNVHGREHIQHSKVLRMLFDGAKDWMVVSSQTEGIEAEERTMQILPKTIGRHPGFVVNILSANRTVHTTFYAKVQSVSMDTVLIHHVLKDMKCGPEVFLISLLENADCFSLGVITESVKDWSMVSTLKRAEQFALLQERERLLSTTFLLNILIELGSFGNIPNNRENWGFIDTTDNSIPYPQMSVIDFSRGYPRKDIFESEKEFRQHWEACVNTTISHWQEAVYWDSCDSPLVTCRLSNALRKEESIREQAEHFPFLHSAEAFTTLLQSACDATAQWLHDAVQSARSTLTINTCNSATAQCMDTTSSTTLPLNAFRLIPRPITADLHNQHKENIYDYEYLVDRWNVRIRRLYTWFPFPSSTRTHAIDNPTYTPNTEQVYDENNDMHDPVMITQRTPENIPPFNADYAFVTAPSQIFAKQYILQFGLNRQRNLSMVVNMCEGDVGADTERNVRYSDTAPGLFVPAVTDRKESLGDNSSDSKKGDDGSVMDIHNKHIVAGGSSASGGVDGDVDSAGNIALVDNSAEEEENSVCGSEVVQVGKKRKSRNKGLKQRKHERKRTTT